MEQLLSEPVVELLSGRPVPKMYQTTSMFQSNPSHAQSVHAGRAGSKSKYTYSEVQVVGSPGNVLTLFTEGFGALLDIPANAVDGTVSTLQSTAVLPQQILTMANAVVPNDANGVDDLASDEASKGPYPLNMLGEQVEHWADVDFGPREIAEMVLGPEVTNHIGNLVDAYEGVSALGVDVGQLMTDTVNEASAEINQVMGEAANGSFAGEGGGIEVGIDDGSLVPVNILDAASIHSAKDALTDALVEELLGDVIAEIAGTVEEVVEDITEIYEVYEDIVDLMDGLDGAGGAVYTFHGFKGFCPRSGQTFKPYYMSGTDVVAWRWRIPELIYPSTYKPLVPKFRESYANHVGRFSDVQTAFGGLSVPTINYWGPIYPRAGGILQADTIKARAVAAARAVSIVTENDNSAHIHAKTSPQYDPKKWVILKGDIPYVPNDNDSRTKDLQGKWQLLEAGGSGAELSCHRFGDDDGILPTVARDTDGRITGITADSYSSKFGETDTRLLFNFWQFYDCCSEPKKSKFTVSRSRTEVKLSDLGLDPIDLNGLLP